MNGNIVNISGGGIPDYSKSIAVPEQESGTFSFTAPSDGILFATSGTNPYKNIKQVNYSVNGTSVVQAFCYSDGNTDVRTTTQIPLGKGDTVTTGTLDSNAWISSSVFVPYK